MRLVAGIPYETGDGDQVMLLENDLDTETGGFVGHVGRFLNSDDVGVWANDGAVIKSTKSRANADLIIEPFHDLLEGVFSKDRMCPHPSQWVKLYDLLPEDAQTETLIPPILGVWLSVSNQKKKEVLLTHIKAAAKHDALDSVREFLECLEDCQWVRIDEW